MKAGAKLRVIRTAIPSTPLPTVDEIPQVPEEYMQRSPEWRKFDEDLKRWGRQTRRFILEQARLLNENKDSDG